MGVLLMGRAGCTVVGNMVAGLLANCSLLSLLLVQALSHALVLVSQVILPAILYLPDVQCFLFLLD